MLKLTIVLLQAPPDILSMELTCDEDKTATEAEEDKRWV